MTEPNDLMPQVPPLDVDALGAADQQRDREEAEQRAIAIMHAMRKSGMPPDMVLDMAIFMGLGDRWKQEVRALNRPAPGPSVGQRPRSSLNPFIQD